MSDKQTKLVETGRSRQWGNAALTLLIIIAVVLATGLTPALGSLASETPASSVVPVPTGSGSGPPPAGASSGGSGSQGTAATGSGAATAGGGQLGALSPGQQTGVGGSLSSGNKSAFQSRNDDVHFVVTADRPAYWRTNAYDRYTGSGWQQTGTASAYSPPIQAARSGSQLTYDVRFQKAATALPTAWRPHRVRSGADLQVTPTQAVHAAKTLPAGTRYTASSYRPPRDPTVLKATSGTDPAALAEQYTQLPPDERAALTPAVATITEGATSRYATAKRIEAWLETTKNYSLSVPDPPTDGVASQFVQDMEAGYCEYFATSMTAMLRAQDIPARYVVGYAPGEQSGQNQYTVRALHAHAWVEVYFADVGWVRFDPTPASERHAQEAQAIGTDSDASSTSEYTPASLAGSPGEPPASSTQQAENGNQPGNSPGGDSQSPPAPTGTAPGQTGSSSSGQSGSSSGGSDPTSSGSSSDEPDQSESGTQENSESGEESIPLNVTLNREPVPGVTVVVTVTQQETTVEGARVSFNGDQIGVTNTTGSVAGAVPYATTLNISVTAPTGPSTARNPSHVATTPAPLTGKQSYRPPNVRTTNRITRDGNRNPTTTTSQTHAEIRDPGNNTTKRYTLATNASVSILGQPVTGNHVRVVAAVDDVPLRNASVSLDGDHTASTNNSGMATLTLPADPGNTTLHVERGQVTGNTSIRLPKLTAEATPAAPLALPFTRVDVSVTLNDSVVAGAPVHLNGNQVGTTGPDGTLTTRLPFAETAALQVRKFEQTATTNVQGIYQNIAIAAGGLVVLLGALGYTKRRSAVSARTLVTRLLGILIASVRWLSNALVYVATTTAAWIARSSKTLHAAILAILATLRGQLSPTALATRLTTWLHTLRQRITTRTTAMAANITDHAQSIQRGDEAKTQSDYRTFREAWDTLLTHVSVRRPNRYTPGELAAHAVTRDDLPREAVATLRNEFRAIEYGHREPSARLERVETASQAIEAAAHAETDTTDDTSKSGGEE
ncbi:transglutaminaseTgpA domain-containing protein [Halobacterium sp. KA-4]|uniref:transglutaminase TgpA family protein n=1 Tax=Halobacterium sp. KA-4 TaxID=2896367 RepID=UPI001E29DBE8|nr:transglutaminaseTgpA domain-containing protein [Halobacterium sp. KA-4]MCD2201016.1 transglutaminaseTgpA domain-containing protein [Halobacterium sp. KA-4]